MATPRVPTTTVVAVPPEAQPTGIRYDGLALKMLRAASGDRRGGDGGKRGNGNKPQRDFAKHERLLRLKQKA